MAENAEAPSTFKLKITTEPSTELAVSYSTTRTGNIVSNIFLIACLDADPHMFQTVDLNFRPIVKDSKPMPLNVDEIARRIITATAESASSVQGLAPPALYTSSSLTTRHVAPPYPSSSASKPKPTHSQTIANLFEIMPSQIQRDLAELGETQLDVDEYDSQMIMQGYNQQVRFTLIDHIPTSLTTNRTRKPPLVLKTG